MQQIVSPVPMLYHYCPTQTGFAILKSRTFRLSALSAANDSLEGRLIGRVFNEIVGRTPLSRGVKDVTSLIVEGYPDSTEGFAFCLSENGDLLSQWRAYASDGSGIAIGFDPDVLVGDYGCVNFGARFYELERVKYGTEELPNLIAPMIDQLVSELAPYDEFVRISDGYTREQAVLLFADKGIDARGIFTTSHSEAGRLVSLAMQILAPLHFKIYQTKPITFHEEHEWRLLRYRHREAHPEVEFDADPFSIKPFIPCFIADPAKMAIKELFIGPRNKSNIDWVRAFLSSIGLEHVRVRRSTAESYR